MSRLPVASGAETVRALKKAGFDFIRQSGSHLVLQRRIPGGTITVVVPNHPELATGTLRAILRKAGVSVEEFRTLL